MEAVEFLKAQRRMCNAQTICTNCPLGGSEYCNEDIDNMVENGIKERVAIVEQWAKEHPRKTYKQDFMEKFPKAGLKNLCRKNIYGGKAAFCGSSLSYCEVCWNEEMEG